MFCERPARPPTPPPFPFLKIGDRGRVNGCWKKLNALFLWIVLCSLEFYKNLKVFCKLTEEENAGKLFSFKRQIFRINFIYILLKLYLDNPTTWGHVIYSQNWPPPPPPGDHSYRETIIVNLHWSDKGLKGIEQWFMWIGNATLSMGAGQLKLCE